MLLDTNPEAPVEESTNTELEMEAIAAFEEELEAEAEVAEAQEAAKDEPPVSLPAPASLPEPVEPEPVVAEEPSMEERIASAVAIAVAKATQPQDEPVEPVVEEPQEKKKFITKEIVVDKYTIVRNRVELTPSVCDKCGFDVAARNDLGVYKDMTPEMQAQVKAAVQEHKDIFHTIATDLIVDEDEVPTEWLGQHKKF